MMIVQCVTKGRGLSAYLYLSEGLERRMASRITDCDMIPSSKFEIDDNCWQSALDSPTDRLAAMYLHSKLTDLIITFPGHTATLKVHRLVLAMSSPVFECMLFGPMAEGDELKLPEDPPEAFKWLMQYIYSGSSYFPRVRTAVQVFHLASKYQMKALFKLCSQYLQKNVNGSNLPLIYDAASLLEDAALQETCSKVLSSSAETVLLSSDIGQLSRESMKHLLQQDLNIKSEVSIFKGLVKWGREQACTQTLQLLDTPETKILIRQVIEEFLPQVRFLTMELHEFLEDVMSSRILTPEEGIAIMMNMRKVEYFPLPEICSKVIKKRVVFDLSNMHKVILNNLHSYNWHGCYTASRQKCIKKLKVSKDLYLGSVIMRNNHGIYLRNWHVEVTDDSGAVLEEVKNGEPDQENNLQISATFSTPVLLRLGRPYDIWVSGAPTMNNSITISNQYRNVSFSGCLQFNCYTEIGFWSPDVSL